MHSSYCIYVFFVSVIYALIWQLYYVFLYYLVTNSVSNRFAETCMDLMNLYYLRLNYNDDDDDNNNNNNNNKWNA